VSNQFRICPRQSLHLIRLNASTPNLFFENRCFVFLDSKWHSTQDIVLDNAFQTTSPTFCIVSRVFNELIVNIRIFTAGGMFFIKDPKSANNEHDRKNFDPMIRRQPKPKE
jgi:hypothetical protein